MYSVHDVRRSVTKARSAGEVPIDRLSSQAEEHAMYTMLVDHHGIKIYMWRFTINCSKSCTKILLKS